MYAAHTYEIILTSMLVHTFNPNLFFLEIKPVLTVTEICDGDEKSDDDLQIADCTDSGKLQKMLGSDADQQSHSHWLTDSWTYE